MTGPRCLAPGLGIITAFTDKRSAVTANVCYRGGARDDRARGGGGQIRLLPDGTSSSSGTGPRASEGRGADREERAGKLLPRHVVVVIGGGSGIGKAAARRFADEGAHVVVADVDGVVADGVAAEIGATLPGRVIGAVVDVRDDASLDALFRRAVLELAESIPSSQREAAALRTRHRHHPGRSPADSSRSTISVPSPPSDARRRSCGARGSAARSWPRCPRRRWCPGRRPLHMGSKAALMQALRVAAVELGADGIRVNAINADQVETPLFLRFVEERAASRGVSVRRAARHLPPPQPHGREPHPRRCGGRHRGTPRERAVPVYHRRHHHRGRRAAGGVSEVGNR